MNISSLLQSGVYNTSSVYGSTNTTNSNNSRTLEDILKSREENQDSVYISQEGMALSKMPPPPADTDFSNMSDEDLTNFLRKIEERTGSIPGTAEGTAVSELTEEDLQVIREQLTDMFSQIGGMGGMKGPPPAGGMRGSPPTSGIQEMSDDDLLSLLESIKEETGIIPGVEDSESTEVSELDEEELQSARDALEELMEEQLEKMKQSRMMSEAISAYELNSIKH